MSDIRHFIDIANLSPQDLRLIIDWAKSDKLTRKGMPKGMVNSQKPLQNYSLAMIFGKPSTRTRVSFEMAMHQLGGSVLCLNQNDMQLGRGECISDTAKVLSNYVDIVMIRTSRHEDVIELAKHSHIPVINGLTAHSHPCQIIADIMTCETYKGDIKKKKVAWIGDGNNVAVSWIQAACLLDFELYLAVPKEFYPSQYVLDWMQDKKNIHFVKDPKDAVSGAVAVNTDCWFSMSDDPKTKTQREQLLQPYQVTQELMSQTDNGIFLHCLPAYRDKEVCTKVIDGVQSVVFEQAENRLYAQKAILQWCLKKV